MMYLEYNVINKMNLGKENKGQHMLVGMCGKMNS